MTSLQGTGPHRINKQGLCQQVEMEVDVAAESKDFNLKHIQKRDNLNFSHTIINFFPKVSTTQSKAELENYCTQAISVCQLSHYLSKHSTAQPSSSYTAY